MNLYIVCVLLLIMRASRYRCSYFIFQESEVVERTDVFIKMVIGVITSIISIFTGLFGLMFTVLLGLMAIDFITGVMGAIFSGEGLKSNKGYRGLFKKIYTMLLIGAVLLIEIAVLKTNGVLTDGVSAAFIVIEFVSIVENGGKMGVKIPKFLQKTISTLKNKVGEEENKESTEQK
jgi:toxin secretion/phage lysis holin